jgi:TP901 family phage tail tape measure protein
MDVFKLIGRVVIENDDANSTLDDTSSKAESSEGRITSAFKKIGAAVATYFAVDKIKSFAQSVVTTTADFEDAMLKVQSLSGATAEEYQALTDAALEYGSTTAWTSKDVADAMGYMALAGFDTNEILSATSGMLSLASASGEELATVSDILTDAMTGFGDSAQDASRYADVLATTQAKSNTTVGALGEAFTYVSSLAGTYSYSLEDVSAALGTMANAGVKGSMAGTALSTVITRLGTNTSGARDAIEALGVEFYNSDGTARDLGDVLMDLCDATEGLDTAQKAELANTVAGAEAQKGLLAILNQGSSAYSDLQNQLYNCSGAADDMATNMESGVGGAIRSMQSALEGFQISLGEKFSEPIGNAVRNAASWVSGTLTPSITGFIDDFGQRWDSFTTAMSPSIENLKTAFGNIATAVQPIIDAIINLVSSEETSETATTALSTAVDLLSSGLNVVAGVISTVTGFCQEHETAVQAVATAIGVLVAAYAGLEIGMTIQKTVQGFQQAQVAVALYSASTQGASVAQGVMNGTLSISEGLVALLTGKMTLAEVATNAMSVAQGALNAVMSANPIALVVAAIAALIAIGVALYKNWDTIKEKASQLKDAVVNKVSEIKEGFTEKWKSIKETIANSKFGQAASTVMDAMKKTVSEKLNNIKSAYEEHGGGIKGIVSGAIEGVKGYYTAGFTFLDNLTNGKLTAIKDAISEKLSAVKETVSNIFNKVKESVSNAWDTIKNVVQVAVMFIGSIINLAKDIILIPWNFIWQNCGDKITEIWNTIYDFISEKIQAVSDFISSVLTTISDFFTSIWNTIYETVSTYINNVLTVVTTVFTAIWSFITEVWNTIYTAITTVVTAIQTIISTVFNAVQTFISTVFTAVWSFIVNIFENIRLAIVTKLTAAKDSVTSIFNTVKTFISTVGSTIWSVVTNAFENVRTSIVTKLNAAKDSVTSIFTSIKEEINNKIEDAKSIVSAGVEKLKSFFNFTWELPKIKLPHFSISGSFSLNPPSVPSFGIEWYKNGGIMLEPTAFGINPATGKTMIGGEAGKEAIAPIETLKQYVGEAVAGQNEELLAVLNLILQAIYAMDEGLGEKLYNALLNLKFQVNEREFARLVRAVD